MSEGNNVPSLKLSNGYKIPTFGLGTWKSEPGVVGKTVEDAIDVGYRHIDCALVYQNEQEVGGAIANKIKKGVVKREDLFVTSKLWNTHHRPELVIPTLRTTLTDLKLVYVDLYLIHFPVGYKEEAGLFPKDGQGQTLYSDVDFVDTWKSMEECVRFGLAKSIGVSNFNSQQIQRILDCCKIRPVVNQVECHPYLNQTKLQEWCNSKGIVLTAYSPLGSPDRPWAKPGDPKLLEDAKLGELAKKYGKSPAQIVLRWLVQREMAAIPKTVNKNRLIENISIFDFKLTDEDMAYLSTFNRPADGRVCHMNWDKAHKYYPFNAEF